jgi:tetratricopeptide (TPR) repeat protein
MDRSHNPPGHPGGSRLLRWLLPCLLLGAAVLLAWGHTVRFGFVWDDKYFIRDLPSIRSLSNLPAIFSRLDAQSTMPEGFTIFRPVRTAHYAVLCALDGHTPPSPGIFHLANVLWHGATAMLLFATACRLLRRLQTDRPETETRWWAFWLALAFAVHPVTSEVVCWAKSQDDILAAFFTLAALRETLCPPESRRASWRGVLFFALAIYTKESAVPFVAAPLLVARFLDGASWRAAWRRALPFATVAAVYLMHRHLVIGRTSQTAPISGGYVQTLIDTLPAVPAYFRLLWGVPPFAIDYSFMRSGHAPGSAVVLGSLALLAVLVAVGWLAWRSVRWRAAGCGLLWTGLFLLPVSNLVPMMQYMAERFLYLPLAGWLLAIAALFACLPRPRLAQAAALALVLVWGVTARERSWIWQDELTLFVRTSQEGPSTARVENNAATAIVELPHVRRFFAADPRSGKIVVAGPIEPACQAELLQTFQEAVRLLPRDARMANCLGITYAAAGRPDLAVPVFEKAAQLDPQDVETWLNLVRARTACGRFDPARAALAQAAALAPEAPARWPLQFEIEWQAHDYAAAREAVLRWRAAVTNDENTRLLAEVERKLAESK